MLAFENAGRIVLDAFADDDFPADVDEVEHPADGVAGRLIGQLFLAAAEPLDGVEGSGFGGADEVELHHPLDIVVMLGIRGERTAVGGGCFHEGQ